MKKYRKILSLLLVFLMAFSLSSCKKQDGKSNIFSDISVSNKEVKKENDKNKGIIKIDKKRPKKFDEKSKEEIINIKAGGDLMAHMDQVDYARNYGNGKYDFSNQFEYVKDFLKDSDLTIGNFETSVSKTREPS